jgi:transaldolase / glucose-6-phosphate isomerase
MAVDERVEATRSGRVLMKGVEMDIKELEKYGQAIWLDYIRRDLLASGEFARLVKAGIRGVTTNPSIFEKAIAESKEYGAAIERCVRRKDEPAASIYEHLSIEDIQQAADILRPVYHATDRRDGYISMEVSPHMAHDTTATLDEARRLRAKVRRENLMIKVPGTPEGIPAIEKLTAEGINVNVTLLFSRGVCRRVFEAYMSGLESHARQGGKLDRIASVASMFVSRIDTMVDSKLAASRTSTGDAGTPLVGKVAIANAKLAYQDWKETVGSARWQTLANQGARPQRLLWASTGTKDPRFSDVLYVESLIGPDTVDTVPPATLAALRDHGVAENRLEQGVDDAGEVIAALKRTGISLEAVTQQLLDDGVKAFSSAFDKLIASIESKRQEVLAQGSNGPRTVTA